MLKIDEVAHNIGHHAMSGMSSLIPHLFTSCRETGQYQVAMNLLSESSFLPTLLLSNDALVISAQALKSKFKEILAKSTVDEKDLKQAALFFAFETGWPDTPIVNRYLQVHPEAEYGQNPSCRMASLFLSKTGKKYVHHFQSWHYDAT